MKLAAIIGSPHGMKGNTGQLLDALIDAAEQAGAETRPPEAGKLFSLDEIEVKPCVHQGSGASVHQGAGASVACDTCHKIGACDTEDDFEKVEKAMLEADGIVLTSPNYMMSVTAQMKCVLDRCASPLHVQAFQGKYGAAVVTSGGPGGEEVEAYLLRFLGNLGCWTVGSVGADGGQMMRKDAREEKLQAAAGLGRQLADSIRTKRRYAEQEAARAPKPWCARCAKAAGR